jgi:hypothetical protein
MRLKPALLSDSQEHAVAGIASTGSREKRMRPNSLSDSRTAATAR